MTRLTIIVGMIFIGICTIGALLISFDLMGLVNAGEWPYKIAGAAMFTVIVYYGLIMIDDFRGQK